MATGRVPTTANSPLTTKGDLFTYSTTQARLAAGSNGDTLVADSSATTGLRWQPTTAAGKNFLINGAMDIWQRGTSSTSLGYVTADRWYINNAGGTTTSAQETTVVPSVSRYSLKLTQSVSAAQVVAQQPLESTLAIPLAGQNIVVSAYVAASASTNFTIDLGTSTSIDVAGSGSWTFTSGGTQNVATTTFVRVSQTFTVSATAKSIMPRISMTSLGSGNSFYISGVQLELGSTPTAFSRAGGTLQGELAACQRYYWRAGGDQTYQRLGWSQARSATVLTAIAQNPVIMRANPTSIDYSTLVGFDGTNFTGAVSAVSLTTASKYAQEFELTVTGATQYRTYGVLTNNSTAGYLGFSAEL